MVQRRDSPASKRGAAADPNISSPPRLEIKGESPPAVSDGHQPGQAPTEARAYTRFCRKVKMIAGNDWRLPLVRR
jgi:hypothetical protein